MNAVLLLLWQLVVTAGAAAQSCSILSEVSAAASGAAAALATATNIAVRRLRPQCARSNGSLCFPTSRTLWLLLLLELYLTL